MNKILNKKINNNLTRIIGSYLLSHFEKIDIDTLKYSIGLILEKLDGNWTYNHNFEIEYYKNFEGFNNCKIKRLENTGYWTIN